MTTSARTGSRRRWPLDALLALCVGAAAYGSAQAALNVGRPDRWHGSGAPGHQGPLGRFPGGDPVHLEPAWPILPAVVLMVVALALRGRSPRLAYAGVLVGLVGYLLAGGPYGPVVLAPAVAVLALAGGATLRTWLVLAAPLPVALSAGFWRQPYLGLADPGLYATMIFGTAVVLVPGLFAMLRRVRREAAERDREAELRRVAYEERMRVAREVHDLVGHSLSVINLQAGVALHVLDSRPDQVGSALAAIKQTSKDAMVELRTTLALFRDPGIAQPTSPQQGLSRLADLVAAVRAGGRQVLVDLPDPVHLAGLPAAVDHAAFRIVQEAVTNAVRHAPGAAIAITVRRDPDCLSVEVRDDGPAARGPPVAGGGISGMQERAGALGGDVRIEALPGGGVQVRARLPCAPTSPSGPRPPMSTPAVSTPAVSTTALSTPAVSTPAVSTAVVA